MKVRSSYGAVPATVRRPHRTSLVPLKERQPKAMEQPKKHHRHHHHRHKHHRHRSLSPAVHVGSHGVQSSASALAPDPYQYRGSHSAHPSHKSGSERTVPIPTSVHPSDSRSAYYASGGHAYHAGRPRSGTYGGSQHLAPPSSQSSHYGAPAPQPTSMRSKQPVIHSSGARAASPKGYDPGYYLTPSGPTGPRREQKKRYSIEGDQPQHLVEGGEYQDPYAQGRYTRSGHRGADIRASQKGYHLSGPATRPKDLEDDYYSYTDAAGMYRDTEPPRWRPRSGSVDRRPEHPRPLYDTHGRRDLGPPPTTRGFGRLNEYYGPAGSRDSKGSPPRGANSQHGYGVDKSYTDPTGAPSRRQPAIHQDREENLRDSRIYEGSRSRYRHDGDYEERNAKSHGYSPHTNNSDVYARHAEDQYAEAPVHRAERRETRPRPYEPYEAERRERNDRPEHRERHRPKEYEDDYSKKAGAHGDVRDDHHRDYEAERERVRRRDRDQQREGNDHMSATYPSAAGALGAGGLAAATAKASGNDRLSQSMKINPRDSHHEREPDYEREDKRDGRKNYDDLRSHGKQGDRDSRGSPDSIERHERHYVDAQPERPVNSQKYDPHEPLDPDEDYRRRVKRELERNKTDQSQRDSVSPPPEKHTPSANAALTVTAPSASPSASDSDTAAATRHSHRRFHQEGSDNAVSSSTSSLAGSRENRVRIVPPSKHSRSRRNSSPPDSATTQAGKGILRKPTEKFPEDPNPILEGVAPLKDASKQKGIPADARWTKIDRRKVSPAALEEAKERFVERLDCVIVLRVLTKEEIQKFATRTAEIREDRDHHARRRHRHHARREKHQRSKRSGEDGDDHDHDDDDGSTGSSTDGEGSYSSGSEGSGSYEGDDGRGHGGEKSGRRERDGEHDREREKERERERERELERDFEREREREREKERERERT